MSEVQGIKNQTDQPEASEYSEYSQNKNKSTQTDNKELTKMNT